MPIKTTSIAAIAAAQPSAESIDRAIETKEWLEAERLCLARLGIDENDQVALRYLGHAQAESGRLEAGCQSCERAVALYPTDAVSLIKYSGVLTLLRDFESAYKMSKRATEAEPQFARAWISLSAACYMQSKHQEAVAAARRGLALTINDDEHSVLLINLASNLRDLGHIDEALAACRDAIALNPNWEAPYTNQMLFLQSRPESSAMDLYDAARVFAERFESPYVHAWPSFAERNADPHRKLRIAFLSPDFNQHSVMYFVESLLPRLDRQQFCVIAVYLQWGEDRATQRVRRHADEFHTMAGLDHARLAKRLEALQIDVLIDIAGHTAFNGLGAMARKPAPVQATWLGFPGTTGLQAIDWRITDGIADQAGADSAYVESLVRLPDVFCAYRPHSRNPLYRYQPAYQVRPTPAMANGYITFGSCNGLSKLTDEVLRTWARVLTAVPGSRLLIEGKGLDTDTARAEFGARCAEQGIAPAQLDLIDRDMSRQYLTYHHIDIALDSFPLTGGTTSADVLWMGVPMVTMNGESFRSRMGVSLLCGLGHPEWVATDTADYVRIAQGLAGDLEGLNQRRLGQRQRMEQSPLMDEERFCVNFGVALRSMWHHWCAQRQFGANTSAATRAMNQWATHPYPAPVAQVTVAPGQMIGLAQAHAQLQALTEKALAAAPRSVVMLNRVEPAPIAAPEWFAVLALCECLLDSLPNEPLALATLAEIEHTHGHLDLAATYLHYARIALNG